MDIDYSDNFWHSATLICERILSKWNFTCYYDLKSWK